MSNPIADLCNNICLIYSDQFGVPLNKIWPGEFDIHHLSDPLILFYMAVGSSLAFHTYHSLSNGATFAPFTVYYH